MDEEVLPFSAWSSRFTSFRGLCQFSTSSSFRQRAGHPVSAGFVRPALRFMNLFSTKKWMPEELCTGAGLAEAFSTFFGPEDGHRRNTNVHVERGPLGVMWPKQSGYSRNPGGAPWKVARSFPTFRLTPRYKRTSLLLSKSERLNHAGLQPVQLFLRQNCGPRRRRRPVQNCERQRTYGCRLSLAEDNCGKNHSVEHTGRNQSQLVSIATAPRNHAHCLEFVTVCRSVRRVRSVLLLRRSVG